MILNKEIFVLASRSLFANRLRSFLTMLGMIIGVGSVIALMSIGAGIKTFVSDQFSLLGANNIFVVPGKVGQSGSSGRNSMASFTTPKLKKKHLEGIKRLSDDIILAAGDWEISSSARYQGKEMNVLLVGVSEDFFETANVEIERGRRLDSRDLLGRKKVAVIGAKVQEEIFEGVDPLGRYLTLSEKKFLVVGVAKKRGSGGLGGGSMDAVVYAPLPTVQSIEGSDSQRLQTIIVKVSSQEKVASVKEQIRSYLLKELSDDDFSVLDQSQVLETINTILSLLTYALAAIASISLLVGGVGIMNIMFVSVKERTREIGIRKAVGARPADIKKQFLIEALILSLLGGLGGVILGVLASLLIGHFLVATITPFSIVLSLLVCFGVGIIFGVAPAAAAAKLNPIEALRYE